MKKIVFGIVGCGHIAARHAMHIHAHPEAELGAYYDIDHEKSIALAQRYPAQIYSQLDELLKDESIDIVSVCTPNGDHAHTSLRCLANNKNVLVEKPMAIRTEDAERMRDSAIFHNKKLYVVKQNRYNPPVQAVKKLIENNALGKIFSIQVQCIWNRPKAYYQQSNWRGSLAWDGGSLYTQFSHFIDIIYYLCGSIEPVSGLLANQGHKGIIEIEDTGQLLFRLPQVQALGSMHYSTNSYSKNMEGSITIIAESGSLKIGGQYLNTLEYQDGNWPTIQLTEIENASNDYGFYKGTMSNHDKVIDNVVSALKGREPIMTNADEGCEVVRIIENFYRISDLA